MSVNSIQKLRGAAITPLGFIKVPAPGTPVSIMFNLDPGNNNAPGTPTGITLNKYGADLPYSPAMRGFGFQGYHQAANNSVVVNTGQAYVLVAPAAGGSGNNQDSGAIVKVVPVGGDYFYPPEGANIDRISPYYIWVDADVAGEGLMVVAYGASGG